MKQGAFRYDGRQRDVRLQRDLLLQNPARPCVPRFLLRRQHQRVSRGVDESMSGIAPSITWIAGMQRKLPLELLRRPSVVGVEKREPFGTRARHADVSKRGFVSCMWRPNDRQTRLLE